MELHFANPKLLLLLWLVPAVSACWYTMESRREQALARFMSPTLQRTLRPASTRKRFVAQLFCLTLGLVFCMLAAARPQWGQQEELVYQRGRDLMIALDVSRSMLATDVRPNRLERAKADIQDLVKELGGDRAALLAFRRRAILLCPLTTDYAYFRQALEGAGPDSAPPGETDIGEAIREAMRAFETEGGAHKAIILISDGEDLAGGGRAAAEEAAKRGIVIFTVGLGSRDGAAIPDAEQASAVATYRGEAIRTRLDNQALHEIAALTHGAYVPVETASMTSTTLGTLYRDHLRNITERDIEERLQRRYVERFQWFLLPGFLCVLAAAAFSRGRLARRARRTPADAPSFPSSTVSLILLATLTSHIVLAADTNAPAQVSNTNTVATLDVPPGRSGARIAQRFYERGEYAQAAHAYRAAATGATEDAQRDYRYNAAVALYHAGQYQEAAELLRDLAEVDDADAARITSSLGASLFQAAGALQADDAKALELRADLTRKAADAFRRAARAAPEDTDAARHAALALRQLDERKEAAHIAKILTQYQSADAGKIASEMLRSQRSILAGIQDAATNAAPSRIGQLEALSREQRTNADRWIALKGRLLDAQIAAGTNAPVSNAELAQIIELTRDGMLTTAQQLRDLDPAAGQKAMLTEATVYQLWKATAAYGDLLAEDIRLQTNAIASLADESSGQSRRDGTVAQQREARELTGLFVERFEQQVPEQQGDLGVGPTPSEMGTDANAAAGSNQIDRVRILDLASQASAAQNLVLQTLGTNDLAQAVAYQNHSLALLKEIESLLPRSQSQNQQPQDQQQRDQQQDKSDEQQESPPQETPQDQEPQDNQDEQEQASPADDAEDETEDNEQDQAQAQEDALPPESERMLERALQREREHEAKRRRQEFTPLSPVERDW
ncbi:MAG: VWA domain-containing protein [Verrucomicrobia bacterium]|nr:VWA domain-containing protein [Verrucomicrobiota bacterium]